MKFLDLNNVQKYFYMADKPYYKLQQFMGNINIISGTALNTLSNEINEFYLTMNEDNSITFKINDEIKALQ